MPRKRQKTKKKKESTKNRTQKSKKNAKNEKKKQEKKKSKAIDNPITSNEAQWTEIEKLKQKNYGNHINFLSDFFTLKGKVGIFCFNFSISVHCAL